MSVTGQPFSALSPIHNLEDLRRLEKTPLEQAVWVTSTYEILCNSGHAFGSKTALTFLRSGNPDDEPIRWSYRELVAGIHQTANLLHRLGVQPTDAAAILLPGCLEYHLALWGGEAAGIVLPLNPLLNDEKLIALMRAAGVKVLFAYGGPADADLWSKALRIRSQVPTLTHVLRVAPHDEPAGAAGELPEGVLDFDTARRCEADDRLASERTFSPTDIAAYYHTGGTTGAPKLARHSHGAQVFTAWVCIQFSGLSEKDTTINGFPLFHVAGALNGSLAALSAGVEMIIPTSSLMRNREIVANYWRLVERYRPTTLSGVPTVLAALANVPIAGADISSLRYCRTGAAPTPPELKARIEQLTGLQVCENYGMTETAGIMAITPPGESSPAGCVGYPIPYLRLRLVALDEAGGASDRDLPPGEAGMVIVKGPNLFSGYVDPADSVKAFTADGYLITGDLGWLDDQGRLHLCGRAKELIIRGGHNIDPKVIEDALAAHSAVELCAAVGAPDAYAGELPVAFVTLRPGAAITEEELLAFAAAHVDEPPARPKAVTILKQMPTTNVGKIYKPELRMMAARAVVARVVAETCREAELDDAAHPRIELDARQQKVVVVLDATVLGAQTDALQERLQAALAPLPLPWALRRA